MSEEIARSSGFQSSLLSVFEPAKEGLSDALKWGVGSSLVSLGSLAALFILPLVRPLKENENGTLFYAFFLSGAGLMGTIALFFFVYAARHRNRKLFLFGEGYVETRGDRVASYVRWTDVDEFFVINNGWALGVLTKDGRKMHIYVWSFSDQQSLVERITDAISSVLVNAALQRIRSGETLNFGRIDANEKGIVVHRKKFASPKRNSFYKGPKPSGIHGSYVGYGEESLTELPWTEVMGIYQDEASAMYIKTNGKKVRLNCLPIDVPNVLILPELAQKLKQPIAP